MTLAKARQVLIVSCLLALRYRCNAELDTKPAWSNLPGGTATQSHDAIETVVLPSDEDYFESTRKLTQSSGQANARRLWWSFSFPAGLPDLGMLARSVWNWAQDAINFLANAVKVTFEQAVGIFNGARSFIAESVDVVQVAMNSSKTFGNQTASIYDEFRPLQRYFENPRGMLALMASPGHMQRIGGVILALIDLSDELIDMSGALDMVTSCLAQIRSVFSMTLQKLGPEDKDVKPDGRYKTLMDGTGLMTMNSTVRGLFEEAHGLSKELKVIDTAFNPMLRPVLRKHKINAPRLLRGVDDRDGKKNHDHTHDRDDDHHEDDETRSQTNTTEQEEKSLSQTNETHVADSSYAADENSTRDHLRIQTLRDKVHGFWSHWTSTDWTSVVDDHTPEGWKALVREISSINRTEIELDQDKYETAIMMIIPVWQRLEALGMKVCDIVRAVHDGIQSLKCRVLGLGDRPSAHAVENAGKDCWHACDRKSGLCEQYCGDGNACCRQGEMDQPEECARARHFVFDYHECVKPGTLVLENEHEDCWDHCDQKSGLCDFCGAGNACCRSDEDDAPSECKDAIHTVEGRHECIIPKSRAGHVGFVDFRRLPGMGYIHGLVGFCRAEEKNLSSSNSSQDFCPLAAFAANVKNTLSVGAPVLGWTFAYIEFSIQNSVLTQAALASVLLAIGVTCAFFGYKIVEMQYAAYGFVAGVVLAIVALSAAMVFAGVCRHESTSYMCSATVLLSLMFMMGFLCAWLSVRTMSLQQGLYGFNSCAVIGAAWYVVLFRQQVVDGIILEPQNAQWVMIGFIAAVVGTGLLGVLIVYLVRHTLMVGATAIGGGFVATLAVNVILNEWLGKWFNLICWSTVAALGIIVQYVLFLRHVDPRKYEQMPPEQTS